MDQMVAVDDPGHQPEVVAADVEDRPLAYGLGRGVDAANVLQVLPATVARSSVSSTPERIPPAAGLRAQTLTFDELRLLVVVDRRPPSGHRLPAEPGPQVNHVFGRPLPRGCADTALRASRGLDKALDKCQAPCPVRIESSYSLLSRPCLSFLPLVHNLMSQVG